MFALLVYTGGKAAPYIDDIMPHAFSKRGLMVWARQRLWPGYTVEVVNMHTGEIVFTETCAA